MSPTASSSLFQPVWLGDIALNHRIVLAPMTRRKAGKTDHVPILPLVEEYYSQRSRTPGSLLITEGTFIAAKAGGYTNIPGIWSDEQIAAWSKVTDSVHANGSYIFLQLWALGRTANNEVLKSDNPNSTLVAPSPIAMNSSSIIPRALTVDEIREYVQLYAQAAKNAVYEAGFDGVEVHGANGYLVDQFLQDVTNQRTDEYGGSIENRSRFGLEVIDAVVNAVGERRTAIRLSPWSPYNDMGMSDPIPQFTHFITTLKSRHPNFAYLHVIEPRIDGVIERDQYTGSNDFIRTIWAPLPLISAGGYDREDALRTVNEKGGLISFGRLYISNPDLPVRLKENIALAPYNRNTFYRPGDAENPEIGYIDYPPANIQRMQKGFSLFDLLGMTLGYLYKR